MPKNLIPIKSHFSEMEEKGLFNIASHHNLLKGGLKTVDEVSVVIDAYLTRHEHDCQWDDLEEPTRGRINLNVCRQRGGEWIRSGAMSEMMDFLELSPTFPYEHTIATSPTGQRSLRFHPKNLQKALFSPEDEPQGPLVEAVEEPTIIDEGDALTLIDNLSDDCMVSLLEKHGGVLIDSVSDITVTVEDGKVRAKNCTWEFTTGVSALRDPNFLGMIEARM